MRGGFVHNQVLLRSIAQTLQAHGAAVRYEVWVQGPGIAWYVDLVAAFANFLLVVEAECSPRRIPQDIAKARQLGAGLLWIIVPNAGLRRSARRCLDRLGTIPGLQISLLTLGQVPPALTKCLSLFATSNDPSANKSGPTMSPEASRM